MIEARTNNFLILFFRSFTFVYLLFTHTHSFPTSLFPPFPSPSSPPQIKLTRAEIAELEALVATLTAKFDATEVSEKEKAAIEEEKHAAEVEKMKAANATLKDELEAMLAPPRK